MYTSFATNAIKTSYEVRQLRDSWTDERTTQILDKVQESVNRDGAVQTFDWAVKGEEATHGVKAEILDDKHNGVVVKQEPDLDVQTQEEDEGEVVDNFGNAYRGTKIIEVDRDLEGHINVAVRMRFGRSESLRFTVKRTASRDEDDWHYRAACIQGMTPKIRESVTRCLEKRPRRRDLNATVVCRARLDVCTFANDTLQYLLASYSDFMLAKCTKCQKKLGPGAMLSTARGRTLDWEKDLKTGWQAWHEQCLD